MKIAVCSDLHLEFGELTIKNTENADLLVLSGDILLANAVKNEPETVTSPYQPISRNAVLGINSREFMLQCSQEFPKVVYVAGNHEFYHGKWNKSLDILRDFCSNYGNVHFMENDHIVYQDVNIVGFTLWTNLNKNDPITAYELRNYMNDYRQITFDGEHYRKLDPEDTFIRHKNSLEYLRKLLTSTGEHDKFVVVGHHAPSKQSTHPRYKQEYHINGGYSSDLDSFIEEFPKIKLWTHGHTHEEFDYMIGSTRIVCNPRGYIGYESRANQFALKYVEI